MTEPSKKRDQLQSAVSQLDGGPPATSEATLEEPISQHQGVSTIVVYKRQRRKMMSNRGKRPMDIESNKDGPEGDDNEADVTQDEQPKKKRRKVTENEGPRNRSSPARLFKLNKDLVTDQKNVIRDIEFGGLLDITATSMPGDLSQWIMKHYDLHPVFLQCNTVLA